ncbi:MAG: hypothetical protein MR420_06200 [Spirochaetia bacterium]|nr:hypothetical protein [Spirochaetia bacterium]
MKKLAKVFAMVAGLSAMLSLSSCVLTVKTFAGNSVKIVNDTAFNVKVEYASGAAWEGEQKETFVSAGDEAKINCSAFWPLAIINTTDNTEAVIDSVSPYKGTIKVSKLEFKTSDGSTGGLPTGGDTGGNTTGGLTSGSGFEDDISYTVCFTDGSSMQAYGSYLNTLGLVAGTDYQISGTKVILTPSGDPKVR